MVLEPLGRFCRMQAIPALAFLGIGVAGIGTLYDLGWVTLIGAVLSGVAGLASAVTQNEFSEIIAQQNSKITEQSLFISDSLTGGRSFCYGSPFNGPDRDNSYEWLMIHDGRFPIYDASVRIFDLMNFKLNPTISLRDINKNQYFIGTILPGKAHSCGIFFINPELIACNLFFFARNGDWTQQYRRLAIGDGYAEANYVVRHGESEFQRVVLRQVSPNFPRLEDGSIDWGPLPPIYELDRAPEV